MDELAARTEYGFLKHDKALIRDSNDKKTWVLNVLVKAMAHLACSLHQSDELPAGRSA
jgi:hypothetical protein